MTAPGTVLGTVLADLWEIVAPLERGSTSIVYRGVCQADGHPVAIKVMLAEMAQDPVAVQRCLREARVAQQLDHPHIVRVEGYGLADDGVPYIVMELLEGETLEAFIARERVQPERVVALVGEIAAGLDAAHAAGVIHRDLKPDNCFLARREGRTAVKLLDFGFAKVSAQFGTQDVGLTSSNALLGTPLYMSPEQIRCSRDIDRRTDLWSLGVMAYELLAGDAPFAASRVPDLFVEILHRPIAKPSRAAPALPPAVDAWMARALDREPARRFPSAGAMAESLAAALQGTPPPPAPEDGVPAPAPAPAPAVLVMPQVTSRPHDARWIRVALWTAAVLAVIAAALMAFRRG